MIIQVFINIYLLNDSKLCQLLHKIGLGVYHSSVTLGSREYFYGYCPKGCGIGEMNLSNESESTPLLFQKMYITKIEIDEERLKEIICEMAKEYRGQKYDILTYNCHIFTNDLCKRLCGKNLPKWVDRLPKLLSSIPFISYLV